MKVFNPHQPYQRSSFGLPGMRKSIAVLLIICCQLGCKRDLLVRPLSAPPSTIDGLDLTFLQTGLHNSLSSVWFISENVGFVAAFDGSVYKTTDGGNSWLQVTSGTTLPLYAIHFLNSIEGFMVGGQTSGTGPVPPGAIMLHTTDGGQTWNKVSISLSEKIELRAICFVNDSVGFSAGGRSILSTKDRGITWKETKVDGLQWDMIDVKFIDNRRGMVACRSGNVLTTTDGGDHWNLSNTIPVVGATSLSFAGKDVVYLAGDTSIARSMDFGKTWSNLPMSPKRISQLIFPSDSIGIAFGAGLYTGGCFGSYPAAIYYTTNGGLQWKGNDHIHELDRIRSAVWISDNIGFAISGDMIVKIKRK
jgi:photosystem II stability/assembly factor-like uncharacterized protein